METFLSNKITFSKIFAVISQCSARNAKLSTLDIQLSALRLNGKENLQSAFECEKDWLRPLAIIIIVTLILKLFQMRRLIMQSIGWELKQLQGMECFKRPSSSFEDFFY